MSRLKGEEVPDPDPDVDNVADCEASEPSFFTDKDNEAVITTLLGFITTLLTLTGLNMKFGFGKDPAEA